MTTYLEALTKERENDIERVKNIMESVSPYFEKRILNDALEAYKMYLEEEIAINKSTLGELHTSGKK